MGIIRRDRRRRPRVGRISTGRRRPLEGRAGRGQLGDCGQAAGGREPAAATQTGEAAECRASDVERSRRRSHRRIPRRRRRRSRRDTARRGSSADCPRGSHGLARSSRANSSFMTSSSKRCTSPRRISRSSMTRSAPPPLSEGAHFSVSVTRGAPVAGRFLSRQPSGARICVAVLQRSCNTVDL